jgi:hypothetical protein
MKTNTENGQGDSALQNASLAKWLRARLDKCLPIDNWNREQLEQLAKQLKGEA